MYRLIVNRTISHEVAGYPPELMPKHTLRSNNVGSMKSQSNSIRGYNFTTSASRLAVHLTWTPTPVEYTAYVWLQVTQTESHHTLCSAPLHRMLVTHIRTKVWPINLAIFPFHFRATYLACWADTNSPWSVQSSIACCAGGCQWTRDACYYLLVYSHIYIFVYVV